MKLNDALRQIAAFANLDPEALIAFAAEDTIGGRDTYQGKPTNGEPTDWSGMSMFAAEGQIIYALLRALRPEHVLEIGVASGGTTTHILTALAANGAGSLYSIDIEANSGQGVPERLRDRWTFVVGDALTADLPPSDFILEDGAHTLEFTRVMLSRLKALEPRLVMSHDYYTHEVYGGFFVKQAFDEALPGGMGIKIDGAFTGLGLWLNPDWKAPVLEVPKVTAARKKGAR